MTNVLAAIVFVIVTNYSREAISVGTQPLPCPDGMPGCCVYHCETVYSPTDYFDIEKVIQEERLTYTKTDGTKGYSVIGTKDLSWRKREVRQQVQKSMVTNDWSDLPVGSMKITWGGETQWMGPATNITLNSNLCVMIGGSSYSTFAVATNQASNAPSVKK